MTDNCLGLQEGLTCGLGVSFQFIACAKIEPGIGVHGIESNGFAKVELRQGKNPALPN